jgi:UDP-N-acetylglucosamine 4-epimerase
MYNSNLYNTKFHKIDISDKSFLITGGAGFIGSNIVEYLLKFNARKVRVLDNLSNGYFDNIAKFYQMSNFEFIHGDIRNPQICIDALEGIDYVSHQAALGSVPRSIKDPITSNEVNIGGFLNVLVASKDNQRLKKMVYAASSSTYGDSKELPKVEGREGNPLSPYAVTKAVNEMYAQVFSKVYNFHTIGLRYFNVFGPKQNPSNPYAAVIPIFCKSFINGTSPLINGDGETSRDFTFVENVVQANIKAMLSDKIFSHEVFNIACGDQITLNNMIKMLNKISNNNIKAKYGPERKGDVKHSRACIEKAIKYLDYNSLVNFEEGLALTFNNYKKLI